jgi:hypothetical protein
MKKLALLFIAICFINPGKCNKNGNNSSPPSNTSTADQWSSWRSISSYPLKARATRQDEIGHGNYRWEVSIKSDDLGGLKFTYKIEVHKGDGTVEAIEKDTKLYAGPPLTLIVSGASIARISASNVERTP